MIQRADGRAPTAPAPRLSNEDLRAMAPMRAPRREIHVGLFVVIGLLAVLTALFALTDPGTFRGRYHAYTVVQDADGIRKGDPVRLKGVNIGRIRDFQIGPNGVRVSMEFEKEYHVPAGSSVSIVSGGILQSMVAEIQPGASTERIADGTVLPYVEEAGFAQQAEKVVANSDSVLVAAQALLSQRTVSAVGNSAVEMEQLLRQLTLLATDQRRQLAQLTASLNASAAGLQGAVSQPELARAIARTDSMTIRLDAATGSLQQAGQSLAALTARVEAGEGTLGKLTTDDQLYQNLNAAVTSLNQLTADIRANPRKYINVSVF